MHSSWAAVRCCSMPVQTGDRWRVYRHGGGRSSGQRGGGGGGGEVVRTCGRLPVASRSGGDFRTNSARGCKFRTRSNCTGMHALMQMYSSWKIGLRSSVRHLRAMRALARQSFSKNTPNLPKCDAAALCTGITVDAPAWWGAAGSALHTVSRRCSPNGPLPTAELLFSWCRCCRHREPGDFEECVRRAPPHPVVIHAR